MKCPKCSYLGFETGDRCKNCGYDFSLMAAPHETADHDLNLQVPENLPADADRTWMDRLHSRGEEVAEAHEMPEPALAKPSPAMTLEPPAADRSDSADAEPTFPLFEPRDDDSDEPLIKFPAAPRPPLSVRRTPLVPPKPGEGGEPPLLRLPARVGRPESPPLSLDFADESYATREIELRQSVDEPTTVLAGVSDEPEASGLARRVAAGVTDHVILFGIDLVVLYSTLRMAGLTMGDWQLLPPVPMLGFLLLLKLSYFGAFTAACGQTIGKMAAQIRVVADDAPLDPARAIRRTMLSAVSLLTFGAGFIPAILDPHHRALHDRLARTRVVALPSM